MLRDPSTPTGGTPGPGLSAGCFRADARGRIHLKRGLRLGDVLAAEGAVLVKDGRHRSVYRIDAPQGQLFVKHDRYLGVLPKLRGLIRRSASRREWHNARELWRRRVPTVEALGYGEVVRHGLVNESFLVTKAIPEACSLGQFMAERLPRLPAEVQMSLRRRLAERLADLMATAHRQGIYHNDLHPGNILLSLACAAADHSFEQIPLFLIDVPGIRFSKPLGWRKSRGNLVVLRASFDQLASKRDYLYFWRFYRRLRPELALPRGSRVAAQIEPRVVRFQRGLQRSRDKRCLADNRDFRAIDLGGARAHVVAEFAGEECRHYLADPRRLLLESCHRPIKLSRGSTLVKAELGIAGTTAAIAYRCYRPRSWSKWLSALLLGCRARRIWRAGNALWSRRIAVPRPLLLVENRRFWQRGRDYLGSQWLEGAVNLHEYARHLSGLAGRQRSQRLRQFADSLGGLIGRLHHWRYAHRDLKGCNLVAIERPGAVETYIVDLDGLSRRLVLSRHEAARNLARLAASFAMYEWIGRGDRLRFLRAYLREARVSWTAWKFYWRRVDRGYQRIVRRRKRDGRPLL